MALPTEDLQDVLARLWNVLHMEYDWHVNAKGEGFNEAHELFESFYDETSEHIDMLAERIRFNGSAARMSISDIAAHDLPTAIGGDITVGAAYREAVDLKEDLVSEMGHVMDALDGYPIDEDVLIEIKRSQELHLYKLRQLVA